MRTCRFQRVWVVYISFLISHTHTHGFIYLPQQHDWFMNCRMYGCGYWFIVTLIIISFVQHSLSLVCWWKVDVENHTSRQCSNTTEYQTSHSSFEFSLHNLSEAQTDWLSWQPAALACHFFKLKRDWFNLNRDFVAFGVFLFNLLKCNFFNLERLSHSLNIYCHRKFRPSTPLFLCSDCWGARNHGCLLSVSQARGQRRTGLEKRRFLKTGGSTHFCP